MKETCQWETYPLYYVTILDKNPDKCYFILSTYLNQLRPFNIPDIIQMINEIRQ